MTPQQSDLHPITITDRKTAIKRLPSRNTGDKLQATAIHRELAPDFQYGEMMFEWPAKIPNLNRALSWLP